MIANSHTVLGIDLGKSTRVGNPMGNAIFYAIIFNAAFFIKYRKNLKQY